MNKELKEKKIQLSIFRLSCLIIFLIGMGGLFVIDSSLLMYLTWVIMTGLGVWFIIYVGAGKDE